MRFEGFKQAEIDPRVYTHAAKMVGWLSTVDPDPIMRAVDSATSEADMQQFLAANPKYLVQHLGGGHGRWVLPQVRLGAEYVSDFIVGEKSSLGYEWQLVELESPTKRMFNKNGDASATLYHAIRQILDWRIWLATNQNYAARHVTEGGLGLSEITSDCMGLIVLGRRADLTPATNARRRELGRSLRIQIRSYDFFCDSAGILLAYADEVPDVTG